MEKAKVSGLHEFSTLLNLSTAAAKIAKSKAPLIECEPWAAAKEEVKKKMEAADGAWVKAPSLTLLPIYGYHGYRHGGDKYEPGSRVKLSEHPLMAGVAGLDALKSGVEVFGENEQAMAWAAERVADQLAVAFERDGVHHLAYPLQSEGLKVKKKKNGVMEVYAWESDWPSIVKRSLPRTHMFGNSDAGDAPPRPGESGEALEKLREYVGDKWPLENNFQGVMPEPLFDGVHLLGKLAGSASQEVELSKLNKHRTIFSGAKVDSSLSTIEGISDPAMRRLAWTAIAMGLGDQMEESTAASLHANPSLKAEVSFWLESKDARSADKKDWKFFGKQRASRAATSAMQAAVSLRVHAGQLARASYNSGSDPKATAESYAFEAAPDELAKAMDQARDAIKALDAVGKRIMDKAYELAGVKEQEWMVAQGLDKAIEDAKLLGGSKAVVSAKSINWALANPGVVEGARRALDNPALALASQTARYLGVRGDNDAELVERSRSAWQAKGLGPEGYDGASASEECLDSLSSMMASELGEKKKDVKQDLKARMELTARALQAAFAEGSSGKQAADFAGWCVSHAAQNAFMKRWGYGEHEGQYDRLSPTMPEIEVSIESEAKRALDCASSRESGLVWAMRAVYRAYELGEGFEVQAQQLGDRAAAKLGMTDYQKRSQAGDWLGKAALGPEKAPPLDWSKIGPATRLVDMALRAESGLGDALQQAKLTGGAHGHFAARVAVGLGVEQARDGNELIAKVRDALREKHGLPDSGWKALAKSPEAMLDRMGKTFEEMAPSTLAARAQFLKLNKASQERGARESGFGLELLGWVGPFGLDVEFLGMLEDWSRGHFGGQKSELLKQGVRAISVDSSASAGFALLEAQAKANRMPKVLKSMAERWGKLKVDEKKERPEVSEGEINAGAERKLKAEISLVDDWLRGSEDGVWQTLPAKCAWGDLMRRQATWHEDVVARRDAGQTSGKAVKPWGCPLDKHVDGEWSAHYLGTADELTEEGRAMHHCVSSYSGQCKAGTSRIYSVRLNGERVSTLEFKLKSGEAGAYKAYEHQHPRVEDVWVKSQNLGNCNRAITDPSALAFSAAVGKILCEEHVNWVKDLEAKRSAIAKESAAKRKVTLGGIGGG